MEVVHVAGWTVDCMFCVGVVGYSWFDSLHEWNVLELSWFSDNLQVLEYRQRESLHCETVDLGLSQSLISGHKHSISSPPAPSTMAPEEHHHLSRNSWRCGSNATLTSSGFDRRSNKNKISTVPEMRQGLKIHRESRAIEAGLVGHISQQPSFWESKGYTSSISR